MQRRSWFHGCILRGCSLQVVSSQCIGADIKACIQAEEFVTLVERDELSGLLRRAAAAHPRCLLNLIISGLYHYMELRERREFR